MIKGMKVNTKLLEIKQCCWAISLCSNMQHIQPELIENMPINVCFYKNLTALERTFESGKVEWRELIILRLVVDPLFKYFRHHSSFFCQVKKHLKLNWLAFERTQMQKVETVSRPDITLDRLILS